jgi:hypothetical protein
MKVNELIETLQKCPPNAEVHFTYDVMPACHCDTYCYCSPETEVRSVDDVDYSKLSSKVILSERET